MNPDFVPSIFSFNTINTANSEQKVKRYERTLARRNIELEYLEEPENSDIPEPINCDKGTTVHKILLLFYYFYVHQSINPFLLKSRGMKYCPSGKTPTY